MSKYELSQIEKDDIDQKIIRYDPVVEYSVSNVSVQKVKTFEQAFSTDITKFVEDKAGFKYLSWAYALRFFKLNYPSGVIKKHRHFSDDTGWYVETYVQLETDGDKHYELYPVFEQRKKTIVDGVEVKGGMYGIEKPNVMDINRAYQRCLTKNIAMATGIGLHLYSGEDLPEDQVDITKSQALWFMKTVIPQLIEKCNNDTYKYEKVCGFINDVWLGKIDINKVREIYGTN
jgi:hypothetical protein